MLPQEEDYTSRRVIVTGQYPGMGSTVAELDKTGDDPNRNCSGGLKSRRKCAKKNGFANRKVLLMEEIPHHLGCRNLNIDCCIFSINPQKTKIGSLQLESLFKKGGIPLGKFVPDFSAFQWGVSR